MLRVNPVPRQWLTGVYPPLHAALKKEPYPDPMIVERLLMAGADPNEPSRHSEIPLHLAAEARKHAPQLVKILLDAGANPYIVSKRRNYLPFMLYVMTVRQQPESVAHAIVKILLKYGVNPNTLNYKGFTALQYAIMYDKPKIAKMLIQAGANINAQTLTDGRTALHFAIQSRSPTILQALLQAGAHLNVKDHLGLTPVAWLNHLNAKLPNTHPFVTDKDRKRRRNSRKLVHNYITKQRTTALAALHHHLPPNILRTIITNASIPLPKIPA